MLISFGLLPPFGVSERDAKEGSEAGPSLLARSQLIWGTNLQRGNGAKGQEQWELASERQQQSKLLESGPTRSPDN